MTVRERKGYGIAAAGASASSRPADRPSAAFLRTAGVRAGAAVFLIALLLPVLRMPVRAQLPDSLRIVILGSSTAAGAGASVRDSAWVWRYAAALKSRNPRYTVLNRAVGGYTTYHIQPQDYQVPDERPAPDTLRNITAALALRPSAIIINMPSNDAAKNYSIIEQTQNFLRVTDAAADAGVPVWVCTTQPRNMSDAQRQNLITMRDWIGTTYGDRALDFWTGLATDAGMILQAFNAGDGVHLNDEGHALLFRRVRDAAIPERLATSPVTSPPLARMLELASWPQPAREQVTFRVHAEGVRYWTLSVHDLMGRQVYRADEEARPGPVYRHFVTRGLPRGMYHVLLRTDEATQTAQLLLVR